jgi:two-component system sensor histidine kinase PilS (NtrC family)
VLLQCQPFNSVPVVANSLNQTTSSNRSALSANPAGAALNRRVLTLIGGFRLLVAAALLIVAVLQSDPSIFGARSPQLFLAVACLYSIAAIGLALALRNEEVALEKIAISELIVDSICIVAAVYTSGGVGTGLEALLVVFVAAGCLAVSTQVAYVATTFASLGILSQQAMNYLDGFATTSTFVPAGVVSIILLVFALITQPLIRRIGESEELARQRGVDLENLAQLNQYIIQNLREAILVVDQRNHVRLVNQAALERLERRDIKAGDRLDVVAPKVNRLLIDWRARALDEAAAQFKLVGDDGTLTINAHFAPLENGSRGGPVVIFLEDSSLIAEKVQQTQLAALGRLSASIAHEIRNPIGALSHAGQLLRESPELGDQEKRFIDIIQTNSRRVNEIIENILQLSRKDESQPERLHLLNWLQSFVKEFESTLELFEGQVGIIDSEDIEVDMDPSHLHQVVWNLCENAVKYASETAGAIAVEVRCGRLPGNGRPYLEIGDYGPGVPENLQETIFEPFATGRSGGTGLGLYICRALCERNRANIRYRARPNGGSIFQIVFADPERWNESTYGENKFESNITRRESII